MQRCSTNLLHVLLDLVSFVLDALPRLVQHLVELLRGMTHLVADVVHDAM